MTYQNRQGRKGRHRKQGNDVYSKEEKKTSNKECNFRTQRTRKTTC